jgi:hypothetical protein
MINQFVQDIDQVTELCKAKFQDLTQDQLNWSIDSNTWSIAQNLDHLIIINESYYPVFQSIKTGTHQVSFLAKIPFMVKWFGKMILNSVKPENTNKTKTFPSWEPEGNMYEKDIVHRFIGHQETLKKEINDMVPYLDKGLIIASPINAYIVYSLDKALEIIIEHEKRHIKQAIDVLNTLPSTEQSL